MEKQQTNYLDGTRRLFRYYKSLGDKSLAQIRDEEIHEELAPGANSVAVIVKHMSGNMLSRWTDFLTSDGEKEWRNRDGEFEDTITDKKELLEVWEKGWDCLFSAIDPLTEEDLGKIIYIRNEGHTVMEAMNRQLAHYASHVGQLVYLCKSIRGEDWQSLSIPKGESKSFNKEKFDQDKGRRHFV